MNPVRQWGTLDQIRKDHVARYEFAARQIKRQSRVLDAACGCGYGSWIIQNAGNRVVGVDISRDAIKYAEEHYHGPGYLLGSILDKPWVGWFDALVSFETIEHIAEPEKALKLFRESVDGVFICSVPNENLYPFNAEKFAGDEYPHLRHYTPDEFAALLMAADFKIQSLNCQKSKTSDVEPGTDGMFLVFTCT